MELEIGSPGDRLLGDRRHDEHERDSNAAETTPQQLEEYVCAFAFFPPGGPIIQIDVPREN